MIVANGSSTLTTSPCMHVHVSIRRRRLTVPGHAAGQCTESRRRRRL